MFRFAQDFTTMCFFSINMLVGLEEKELESKDYRLMRSILC